MENVDDGSAKDLYRECHAEVILENFEFIWPNYLKLLYYLSNFSVKTNTEGGKLHLNESVNENKDLCQWFIMGFPRNDTFSMWNIIFIRNINIGLYFRP